MIFLSYIFLVAFARLIHLLKMEIQNPYFCVEFSEEQIKAIKVPLRKILNKDLEIELVELPIPHISISYILGNIKDKEAIDLASDIVEAPFSMDIIGIEAVDSEYYEGTIISLALTHNDDFMYSKELIEKTFKLNPNLKIKEFDGGFKAHISLFVIKGLDEEQKILISRYLELFLSDYGIKRIDGENICVYNSAREKLIQKKF